MEAYHIPTGRLLASGWTQGQIEGAPWFDPAEFAISDTGQILEDWLVRQAKNERWVYLPGLNAYYQSIGWKHAFFAAAETLFTPERWAELEAAMEEHQIPQLLMRGERQKIKKKILRARDKGLITTAEVQTLNQIFNGM